MFMNETPAQAGEAMAQLSEQQAPIVVVLIVQEGCGACEQYQPIFTAVAAPYAKRGLPFVQVDAANADADAEGWMSRVGVTSTPTVLVVRRNRGVIGRLEGTSTPADTRRLLDVAVANNRPTPIW